MERKILRILSFNGVGLGKIFFTISKKVYGSWYANLLDLENFHPPRFLAMLPDVFSEVTINSTRTVDMSLEA